MLGQVASIVDTLAFTALPMAGSILLAYGIYQVIVETRSSERKRLTERLKGRSPSTSKKTTESILRRIPGQEVSGMLGPLLSKMSITSNLQTLLDQAAVPWSATKMLANQVAAAAAAFFGMVALGRGPFVGLALALCALFLPFAWLKMRRGRRMKKLTNQLPDVFEMMSQALRAGHSLASALQVVHEQLPDPISSEFGRVFHEQNLGIRIEDALLSMADRVDSLDVRFFVTAVLIQRQTGGDLAEVLDNIGAVIRDRLELLGMVQSLTAEGRLSGYVLFTLPFIVFAAVMLLNPEYGNQLLEDPTGKIMLTVALGLQLTGLAMIRWIVNIKV
ncbi:MAG: type II secretion system F family protein [Phycisphaerae bacterium]